MSAVEKNHLNLIKIPLVCLVNQFLKNNKLLSWASNSNNHSQRHIIAIGHSIEICNGGGDVSISIVYVVVLYLTGNSTKECGIKLPSLCWINLDQMI